MEYNYKDKEKMDKLENDPKYQKEKKNKWWKFVLFSLPIFIGMALIVTFCSITPDYENIFENETTTTGYYTLGDKYNYLTTILPSEDGAYVATSRDDLISVDLVALKKANSSYSKVMVYFSFSSYQDATTCSSTLSTYQSYKLNLDDKSVSSLTGYSLTYATYTFKEIVITNSSKMTLSISSWGNLASSSCLDSDYKMLFKDIKLYVYGVK